MLDRSKIVGLPISRIDGPLKVTGQARYAAEHFESGMLFGHVALATVAAGRIIALDTRAAERVPGVVKIYTHENRPKAAYRDSKWKDAVALPGHPLTRLAGQLATTDFAATYLALGLGLDPAVSPHVADLRQRTGR